jgi:hypothetical protein
MSNPLAPTIKYVQMAALLRLVSKDLASSNMAGGVGLVTPQLIGGVFKCIGNYVNFTSKRHSDKDQAFANAATMLQQPNLPSLAQRAAIAEIACNFGTFFKQSVGSATEFVPGTVFTSNDCPKGESRIPTDSTIKQELTTAKLATVTQLSEN